MGCNQSTESDHPSSQSRGGARDCATRVSFLLPPGHRSNDAEHQLEDVADEAMRSDGGSNRPPEHLVTLDLGVTPMSLPRRESASSPFFSRECSPSREYMDRSTTSRPRYRGGSALGLSSASSPSNPLTLDSAGGGGGRESPSLSRTGSWIISPSAAASSPRSAESLGVHAADR